MKYVALALASVSLFACSQPAANKSGNAAAPTTNAANSNRASAAPATGPSEPPAAYKAHFDQRWRRAEASVTPAEVEEMLRSQTPQQVVSALWGTDDSNNRWDTVATGIARGDPAWLALAPRIAQGTDAGTSTEFGIAAGDALTTNPAGALRLLSQIEMGVGACTENGIEVPAAQARVFFETAIAMVGAVNDPDLQQIKASCLAALRKGMAEYPGLNGNPPQQM